MANDSVTLFLEGTPTLEDFSRALDALRALLHQITDQVAGQVEIEWRIDALETSSALSTFRGVSADMSAVENTTSTYLEVGQKMARLEPVGAAYERSTNMLMSVLGPSVSSFRVETDTDDVTISRDGRRLAPVVPIRSQPPPQFGSVQGRIETMSRRHGLRFILFDLAFDKAVTCYLAEGQEATMRNAWGHVAEVEGLIKRDPDTGRPTTIRQITNVRPISEGERGEWRRARGVVPNAEPAEDRIRRIRDAW